MLNRILQNRPFLAGSILLGLTLGLAGCDKKADEPTHEPKPETPVAQPGPAAEPGPVHPSPVPSMPVPGAAPVAPDMKPAETKPVEPKVEPKLDPPK